MSAPTPPKILAPKLESIPAELRELPNWVLWRLEWREGTGDKPGKWTKVPKTASGSSARSNDPKTWATFEKAVEAYGRGGFSGIGFMLEGTDIVAVDLDDKEGEGKLFGEGNKPTAFLSEVLLGLDTYAEVSPSGSGVRIFARGTVPSSGRRGDIELYADGSPRYMTVTGRWLSGVPSVIEERTDALADFHARYIAAPKVEEKPRPAPAERITVKPGSTGKRATPKSVTNRGAMSADELTDEEIVELAAASANGAKFSALWNGSTAGYPGASEADMALCSILGFYVGPNSARIDALFRRSGLWREKWDERHSADGRTYGAMTIDRALLGTSEFYQPPGVEAFRRVEETVARAVASPQPTLGAKLSSFNLTDAGNAERLIARYGEDIRHVSGLGWRVWDGKRWASDDAGLTERARDTVRALYGEASELLVEAHKETDRDRRKQLAARAEELSRFAMKSEATRALAAMVEQVRSFSSVRLSAESFALKPWRVPFLNGVWDRGEWREHRREDCTEHLLPVIFDPKADRREWLALLERMTGGDADLARTLQDVAGYALSGASSLRVLPWAYGPKGTGKSTFAELLQTVLGGAGKVLDPSLLSGERDTERLGAAVRGMRSVFLAEAGRKRIDAELLKMLAGSDRVPGRELYGKETFSVNPTWAVFAVANDAPSMNAHDDALRDRVVALPFLCSLASGKSLVFACGRRLEEVRRDPSTPLLQGFAAWAVEGLRRVHEAQEIHLAEVVKAHTRRFWEDTDPLTEFWEGLDAGEIERGISAKGLHEAYLQWRENEQVPGRPLHGKSFAAACRAAGLEQERRSSGVFWYRPQPSLNVGMYEKDHFPESFPKKESIGKVSGNGANAYIPTLDDSEEVEEFEL